MNNNMNIEILLLIYWHTYRSSSLIELRLMSLQIDNDRGRWKNFELRPLFASATDVFVSTKLPLTDITSSSVFDIKLTLRDGFAEAVDDVSSPDIFNAL